jgi:hypothetical protein
VLFLVADLATLRIRELSPRGGHRSPYRVYIQYPYYGFRHCTVEVSQGGLTVQLFSYGSSTGQSNPA